MQASERTDSPTNPLIRDLTRWRGYLAIVVLVLIIVRLLWGLESQRRLNNEIQAGIARGEPAHLADMQPSMVHDHPSAIRIYTMLPAMEWPDEFYAAQIQTDPPALAMNYPRILQSFMLENGQQIELLQAAHSTDWTDAPVPVALGESDQRTPAVNDTFLYELAVAALSRLDHALAFDYVLDLYRCADLQAATWADSDSAQYVAANSRAKAAQFLEVYASRLLVEGARSHVARGIPHAKVRHLISRLLDDENWVAQSRHFMIQERVRRLQSAARPIFRHPLDELVYGPSRRMEQVSAAHWLLLANNAIKEPSLPRARSILPPTSSFRNDLGNWPERKAMAFVQQHYRGLATQRLVAVLLTTRLYWADHGYDPQSIGDLVPQYLPNVPKDPFDPAEQDLHMKQSNSGLLFYSVGYNGVDDGGTWRSSLDWWTGDYGLNLLPTAPPPATPTTVNSK